MPRIATPPVRLDLPWRRSSICCPHPGPTRSRCSTRSAVWAAEGGRPLYPHQEEAALALAAGDHVVLATPTGSGKSLVAVAGILLARNEGRRAVWTAPIKALVAEKFFDLVDLLGAGQVGLATGDAAINAGAPVLVCTAEVLANQALMTGPSSDVGFACLDEFHYYGDADRGWAWQVPLLELTAMPVPAGVGDPRRHDDDQRRPRGTLGPAGDVGDVGAPPDPAVPPVAHDDRRRQRQGSGRRRALPRLRRPRQPGRGDRAGPGPRQPQRHHPRPSARRSPRRCSGVRMGRGFGATLDRLLRNGVGVHHAGMLPRYRRLVERLAGQGLLPVICGTDTLGVGVNIPIRTVLMTALTKFDGNRVRRFTVREFHQLAGRAGRPGFDPDGHVWVQAPEHVIENAKALSRAGDDPKARRKATKAKAPEGFVHYDEAAMERLVSGTPEALTSRFLVTADLVASVLSRPDGPVALKHLLRTNHDPEPRRRQHRRRAIAVYRSLEAAGVAERLRDADGRCAGVRVGSLVEGEDERTRAAVLVAADDVRHRGRRNVRPGRPVLRRRCRERRRVRARGSAPDPVRPAERRQGGRGRPPEGRVRSVRGAHGTARRRSRGRSRWPNCSTRCSRRTGPTTRG